MIITQGEDNMKKALIIGMTSLTLLGLAGCSGGYETGDEVDSNFKAIGDIGDYDLLRDKETGCVYMQEHYDGVQMTPYYGRDGKVMGCGDSNFSIDTDGDFK